MTTVIQRSALVAYPARQMFELVNAIEEYPRFLPWCRSTKINATSEHAIEASIEIAWSGIHKSFSTRNTLTPYEKIHMQLLSGPFRRLEGTWTFIPVDEHGCRVSLDLEFELSGHWMSKLFQPVFHRIADSLVDAFCKRAVEVYGIQGNP
ncbi:MAG: type II toxin-antitoxin system RatA family toxin [Gammaproteobacteria bacterium]|nr:type II toxin-antitoxin system RatA family toxin [Gammaproteobacteria bacterium]